MDNATVLVSLVWAASLSGLFGLGVWRRWRRKTLPLVGAMLLVTALMTTFAIAAIALELATPELRRVFAFASWGAFTAAAVLYASVVTDP